MERGYHATSVRQIADYLNISQSSLYYHGKNKPQVLVDLNDSVMSSLVEAVEEINSRDVSPMEKLEAIIHELLRTIAEKREVVAVVLHERRSLPPDAAKRNQAQRDRVDAIIDSILTAGINDGSIRPVSVPIARLALTGMVNWAYTWYQRPGPLSADAIADGFVDILRHGLQTD